MIGFLSFGIIPIERDSLYTFYMFYTAGLSFNSDG
jgi:hypothetical protein